MLPDRFAIYFGPSLFSLTLDLFVSAQAKALFIFPLGFEELSRCFCLKDLSFERSPHLTGDGEGECLMTKRLSVLRPLGETAVAALQDGFIKIGN
jgi:hypothetical protein